MFERVDISWEGFNIGGPGVFAGWMFYKYPGEAVGNGKFLVEVLQKWVLLAQWKRVKPYVRNISQKWE
jgi:hypothetical protein